MVSIYGLIESLQPAWLGIWQKKLKNVNGQLKAANPGRGAGRKYSG